MSWAALRPSSAAWRVRAVSLTFSSKCFRSALSRRYPLTGWGLGGPWGRLWPGLGATAWLSESRAYERVSPWLSRMIHRVRFGDPVLRSSEPRTALFVSRGDGRRGGRDRDRGARFGRGQRTRFGRVVRERAFRPLLVRDAGLLRHESADPLAVRGLQSEEFRKIPRRRQGEGAARGLAVDEAEILEPLRVLVHLRADHVEQVALEERLVVGDQGRRLQEVPVDLWRGEGTGPFRVIRADLHRPLRPDLRDLDRTFPFRVLLRQGPKVLPDHVRLKPRRPGELLGREGFPGAEEGRFHDGPRVHGAASWVQAGLSR